MGQRGGTGEMEAPWGAPPRSRKRGGETETQARGQEKHRGMGVLGQRWRIWDSEIRETVVHREIETSSYSAKELERRIPELER